MAIRKIPQRKCVACGISKDKRELIRIVKTNDGEISVDLTGKKSGRGAYICRDIKCLKLAKKGHKLDKALDIAISDEIYARLEREILENE